MSAELDLHCSPFPTPKCKEQTPSPLISCRILLPNSPLVFGVLEQPVAHDGKVHWKTPVRLLYVETCHCFCGSVFSQNKEENSEELVPLPLQLDMV